jgi:hypothetical protein
MLKDGAKRPADVLFIKFHDLLFNTLPTLNNSYKFLGLEKLDLSDYHLKLKKVLQEDGSHEVLSGKEGDMVWIPKEGLDAFLDTGVDARQRDNLSAEEKDAFKRGLGDIVKRLDEVFAGF